MLEFDWSVPAETYQSMFSDVIATKQKMEIQIKEKTNRPRTKQVSWRKCDNFDTIFSGPERASKLCKHFSDAQQKDLTLGSH
jgi:hypothetical protein